MRSSRALKGSFPYYSQQVYAPRGSVIFERIVQHGIFEPEILSAMQTLAVSGTSVLDVGANIGVMSAALLEARRDVSVLSIECSPSTLPFLRKTHGASPHKARWQVLEVAVGKQDEEMPFFTAGCANGAFDGLMNTHRGGPRMQIVVRVRRLDAIWEELLCPKVSVIKIDIEGGEFDAISGATKLLDRCRPYIIFEWHATNLAAYQRDAQDIFELCNRDYELFTLPALQPVTPSLLPLLMVQTEMFLLAPSPPFKLHLSK